MTDKELNRKHTEVCNNLAERQLKPAFDRLKKLITENGLSVFNDEWRELDQTYHYMLQYTIEGIRDPERQKIYTKLIVSTYELTDKVHEAIRLKYSTSIEYERKRMFQDQLISDFASLQVRLEDFKLFYHVWFRDQLNQEEIEFLKRFFVNPSIRVAYKSLIVSALTLSLQRYFDKENIVM